MKRGRPPRQMSARRASQQERRAEVVAEVFARDRGCRARALVPEVECGGPHDPHEIIPRSVWRGSRSAVSITIWIDSEPILAHACGLHGRSWERPVAS